MNSIQNLFTELWNKYTLPLSIFEKLTAEFGRYYLNSRIDNDSVKFEVVQPWLSR